MKIIGMKNLKEIADQRIHKMTPEQEWEAKIRDASLPKFVEYVNNDDLDITQHHKEFLSRIISACKEFKSALKLSVNVVAGIGFAAGYLARAREDRAEIERLKKVIKWLDSVSAWQSDMYEESNDGN